MNEYQIDVYYAIGGVLPRGIEKQVATVTCPRNMLPFARQERTKYSIFDKNYWRLRILRDCILESLQRADIVLLISRYGGEVLERHIPGITERSRLVYHGVGEAFRNPQNADVRDLVKGEYILYISEISFYKYHIELLQALDILRREKHIRPCLVLAGLANPRYRRRFERELRRLHLEEQVTWLGKVDHGRLPGLIHNARFCVYSSAVEFCPNIVLEMMRCGAPMAISNRGPMPEIARHGAVYYDPAKPLKLAEAVGFAAGLRRCLRRAKECNRNKRYR